MPEEQTPVHPDVQAALEMIFDLIRDIDMDGRCKPYTLVTLRDLINDMGRVSAEAGAQQSDDRT